MIKDWRQDEFGRSPDNEIKAVTPTGNTSTTLNKEEEGIQKYKNVHHLTKSVTLFGNTISSKVLTQNTFYK